MIKKLPLGDLLIKLNLIAEESLAVAQEQLKNSNFIGSQDAGLAELLLKEKYLSKDQLIAVLEYQTGVTYFDLRNETIDNAAVRMVNEKIARNYKLIPVNTYEDKIRIIMADPLDLVAKDDVRLITGLEPEIYFAFASEIEQAINANYTSSELAEKALEEMRQENVVDTEEEVKDAAEEDVARAPVVRLVNSILEQAVRIKASDIHIEPMEKQIKVRIRVDGDLREMMTIPISSLTSLVARVKIMSSLDIAERRVPQDGRINIVILNRPIDLRVSILPTVYGEKIVMRILDQSSILVTKDKLGFTEHNVELFDKIIRAPEGIILVSGPTGSGKTTTLYAVLGELNKPNVNIITVEDPVEYRLEGVHQVQVNAKAGLTFAAGLRSILRQDPDIVMLGEIRDAETAEIATRAAITGHVVLSTIHTNDTVSTISRLTDMGIEKFIVATALMGVVAQRLVKRICVGCKTSREATDEELGMLGLDEPTHIHYGEGCNVCGGTGYSGRIAIHEVLVMDKELRSMVTRDEPADVIKDCARSKKGLKTLGETCKELVLQGVTTIDEMVRVTYSVDE